MPSDAPKQTDLLPELNEAYRLSPQQRLAWQLHEQGHLPKSQLILQITGSVDSELLRQALERVYDRYEILRTSFHRVSGLTLPLQALNGTGKLDHRRNDLTQLSPGEQDSQWLRMAESECNADFDLEHGPVIRQLLIDIDGDRHFLVLTLPAVSVDRRSLSILACDIAQCLANLTPETPSDDMLQYIEYSEWQNDLLESQEQQDISGRSFWCKKTEVPGSYPTLPIERPVEEGRAFIPVSLKYDLDSSLVEMIDSLSDQYKQSPAALLETLWAVLLYRFTGEPELTLGHVSEGRSYPEFKASLGILAKTLPIRLHVAPTHSTLVQLQETESAVREALDWEEYYLPGTDKVIGWLPFRFEFDDGSDLQFPTGFSIFDVESFIDIFDLNLLCRRAGSELSLEFQYNGARYTEADVRRLSESYLVLLRNALADPQAPVSSLDLLPNAERHQVIVQWNDTSRDFPPVVAVHHLFFVFLFRQLRRSPRINRRPGSSGILPIMIREGKRRYEDSPLFTHGLHIDSV